VSASARCCLWVVWRLRTQRGPVLSAFVDARGLARENAPLGIARFMDVDQGWPVMPALVMAIVAAWLSCVANISRWMPQGGHHAIAPS
jgi:hypothetical protein